MVFWKNAPPAAVLILLALLVSVIAPAAADDPIWSGISVRTTLPQVQPMTPTPTQVLYGALSVSSTPSGASVLIDGSSAGTTPATIPRLASGQHTVILRLTGYADLAGTVTIVPDRTLQKSYTLTPLRTTAPMAGYALLSVTSSPSGATVMLDGSSLGTTPITNARVTTGTHTILVQKAGYHDVTESFTVPADASAQKSYTLRPVTAATTPVTTKLPKVSLAPVPGIPPVEKENVYADIRISRPWSFRTFSVTAGGTSRQPVLTTDSPYYRYQIADLGMTEGSMGPTDIILPPDTIIEVDKKTLLDRDYLINYSYADDFFRWPEWSDEAEFLIQRTDTDYTRAHFRWISDDDDVTAFYQVSRKPFPADNEHWQNQYIPGLVGSGPVEDYHVFSGGGIDDGYHLFDLNFARFANHPPGAPPLYTGPVFIDNTPFMNPADISGYVEGRSQETIRIPGTSGVVLMKTYDVAGLVFPFPGGLSWSPKDLKFESDLGNPNAGLVISASSASEALRASMVEDAILSMDQTFYVRVVPIRANGEAGIPSYPVKVKVIRPQLCPPEAPPDTVTTVQVKPPSVNVASFYLQAFVPNDWIHKDQNGKLVSRGHYLSVIAPEGCDPAVEPQKPTLQQNPICMQYITRTGGGQPNYHFFIDPPEGHWYETFFEIVKGLFGAFSSVINAASAAWSNIQALALKIAASVVTVISFGSINCGQSPACMGVLQAGLSVAMTTFGVPPTIPNFAELQHMGTGYLVKIAAEEMGAGVVYESLPEDTKNEIVGKSNEIANEMGKSLTSTTAGVTASAAGSWYIPDPLYYEPHPAFVIVRVHNPNTQRTDAVTLRVKDTQRMYEVSEPQYIPPLNPGDSISVPVILTERYTDVYTPQCNREKQVTECGGDGYCIPCYWNLWYYRVIQNQETLGPDTFEITLTANREGYTIPLTPSASGTLIGSEGHTARDDLGNMCPTTWAKTYLQYPQGWVMTNQPLSRNLESLIWGKYTFTEGDKGLLIGS